MKFRHSLKSNFKISINFSKVSNMIFRYKEDFVTQPLKVVSYLIEIDKLMRLLHSSNSKDIKPSIFPKESNKNYRLRYLLRLNILSLFTYLRNSIALVILEQFLKLKDWKIWNIERLILIPINLGIFAKLIYPLRLNSSSSPKFSTKSRRPTKNE